MSLPRLSFLYPALLRQRCVAKPSLAPFLFREARRLRHGTAVEPPPPPPPPSPENPPATASKAAAPSPKTEAPQPDTQKKETPKNDNPPISAAVRELFAQKAPDPETTPGPTPATVQLANRVASMKSEDAADEETIHDYAHHFDTYGLVRQLEKEGGFTRGQSVAMMQGLHDLMTTNLHKARKDLLNRSDFENDIYLFQTACTELRNEMQMNKKSQIDQLRSERTRLETEFDLLNQAFMSDMMTLKDELNSMFNDRKMVTRAEQRAMENKIQELNYKITILMGSEMKSEIEKLRWQTTRRGLLAILALASVVVIAIRLSKRESEKKKKEAKLKPDAVVRLSELAPEHSEAILNHARPEFPTSS